MHSDLRGTKLAEQIRRFGDGCLIAASMGGFKNLTLSRPQTGIFVAEFDAVPSQAQMDAVVFLSNGPESNFVFPCAVRFSTGNTIQALDGGTYRGTWSRNP